MAARWRETSEMTGMAVRVIKSIGKRVGQEQSDSIKYLVTVQDALDVAWRNAIADLRESGMPDREIGELLGISRQAVQQKLPLAERRAQAAPR